MHHKDKKFEANSRFNSPGSVSSSVNRRGATPRLFTREKLEESVSHDCYFKCDSGGSLFKFQSRIVKSNRITIISVFAFGLVTVNRTWFRWSEPDYVRQEEHALLNISLSYILFGHSDWSYPRNNKIILHRLCGCNYRLIYKRDMNYSAQIE